MSLDIKALMEKRKYMSAILYANSGTCQLTRHFTCLLVACIRTNLTVEDDVKYVQFRKNNIRYYVAF